MTSRLAWIDALRGYSILAVIAYHACQLLPPFDGLLGRILGHGATGVQLFFMVSGFTIFLTLDQARRRGNLSYRAFFIRRSMRILPLFWLFLAAHVLYYRQPGAGFPFTGFLATLTFASAWVPSLCPTMVPGGWSIAVEMWFYLLAPWLFGAIRSLERALLFAMAAVLLRFGLNEGLARLVDGPPLFPDFLFFWLPNQLPLFALGLVLFFVHRRWESGAGGAVGAGLLRPDPQTSGDGDGNRKALAWFFLLAGGTVLAAALKGFKALIPFHIVFGLGFLLVILHVLKRPSSPLVNRPMVFLGKISYSAYFAHFAVLRHSADWFLSLMEGTALPAEARFAALMAWTLVVTVGVSAILHAAIEKPGQALGRRLAALRPRVAAAVS